MIASTIPVLPTLDLDETIAFYSRLGFAVWSRYEGDYVVLGRDLQELHFFLMAQLDPQASFHGCYWRTEDAPALFYEFATAGLTSMQPMEDKPWGMREFAFLDPHGNLIRIGQAIH